MSDGKRKIIANVPRLNDFMDRHGCSAIVARSGTNITYLSGVAFPGSQGRHVDFPVFCFSAFALTMILPLTSAETFFPSIIATLDIPVNSES